MPYIWLWNVINYCLMSPTQVIDPSKSSVELLGTKTEIKLRKIDGMPWKSLQFKENQEKM